MAASFNKTSKNYKTLVAAARHMKLPDDKTTNADNQTQMDSQVSERNLEKTGQGALSEFGAQTPANYEVVPQPQLPTKPKTQ